MHPETLHRTDPWQGLKKSKIKSFLFSGATSDLQIPVTSSVTSPAPPPFATAMQCKWPPPAAQPDRRPSAWPNPRCAVLRRIQERRRPGAGEGVR